MTVEKPPPNDRGLVWVVQLSSAFSLGTLAALLYSVKAVTPQIEFQVSFAALLAFALAATASVLFWHVVFKLQNPPPGEETSHRGRTRRLWFLAMALGAALVFAFIYPLKDFSSEKVSEIALGAFIALGFLGLLGLLFWRVVRFLESEPTSKQ